ncbi:hypothetical protein GCM10008101_13340 [Lysobacter xinjiangensis]|uniref:Tetratricopeptide repeat protein n=1 Tax=Cognatilysobacter xinjiangensis TaxID=546892 RepID=A0ABQ3C182_9GAMM|nr:hypothetical protein [Lysobacter xinjiangensis]GGZ60699.1 hypothetical protein GCM10008101_13340 [Lysobacter xinjiangensis]
MTDPQTLTDDEALEARAYEAFDRGDLAEASRHFGELLKRQPDARHLHYMQGLTHKYLRDWPTSLEHNLRAQALSDEVNESSAWNAGIAATALGDWAQARAQWRACGIRIPEGEGPIDGDFGLVSIRLNPWGDGETVFARRIDVVRARLLNVPLPESGHRLFDIVLHDGASTGQRQLSDGGTVNVFNALARLEPSDFRTFVAFVSCDSPDDMEALSAATLPGIGYVEDWTASITHYCLRCSYGAPHRHEDQADEDWSPDRNLGIGAQSRAAVVRLLQDWARAAPGRSVEGIEEREVEASEPADGHVWWRGAEDDEDEDEDEGPGS